MRSHETRRTTKPFAEAARLALSGGQPLSREIVSRLIDRHERSIAPRLDLLWTYYRNPMEPGVTLTSAGGLSARGLRLAQERGLPNRLLGAWSTRGVAARIATDDRSWTRKEVVIENDIGWRVHTMVDFMFGRPITISSTARTPELRRTIERVLDAIWESSGGIGLLQDLGLLGHVYGHVDLIVRAADMAGEDTNLGEGVEEGDGGEAGQEATPRVEGEDGSILERARGSVRIEIVEPTRGVALLAERDYRDIDAYIIRTRRATHAQQSASEDPSRPFGVAQALMRWWRAGLEERGSIGRDAELGAAQIVTTEVYAGGMRQVYEDAGDGPRLIDESPALVHANTADRPPIVHIQNISQPFEYAGLSEVEPLVPLQDELNTRLSDRASRVTLQSFRMYLAKGMEGAENMPVAPGVIWTTDNTDARVEPFGGDAASPSEESHIQEVREALDKASGVPPLASGVVRAKIGNLTSENALRVTLMGLLSKTARKRVTYGRGIVQASLLVLEALDRLSILKTDPRDRGLRVDWTDPLPRDERDLLQAAKLKVELGVPAERVLSELGYAATDQGVT